MGSLETCGSASKDVIGNARRPLPVGVESFREICDGNYYYVDKTLLLPRLIEDKTKVILFTRPRRFGKTLNLDMIRTFFEISKEDTARYFRDKKVWACGPPVTERQGRYPVIHLSLLGMDARTMESFTDSMRRRMQEEYRRQLQRLDSQDRKGWAWGELERFAYGQPTDSEVRNSLRSLSEILRTSYGVPAVVLIDEYDGPVEAAWTSGTYEEILSFTRTWLTKCSPQAPGFIHGVDTTNA